MLSSKCIATNQVCDNRLQSVYGEEETRCGKNQFHFVIFVFRTNRKEIVGAVSLVSQGISMALDRFGKPERETNGVVVTNNFGKWSPICVGNWSSTVGDKVCQYIGHG